MTTPTAGGCLCGAVRYEARGEPLARTLCHCAMCRRACGGAAVAWVVFGADDLAFIAGAPAYYASSPGVSRGFCATCGTSLTYRSESRPHAIDITTVTLDEAARFGPTKEIWLAQRLSWEVPHPALEHFPGSSVASVSADTPV